MEALINQLIMLLILLLVVAGIVYALNWIADLLRVPPRAKIIGGIILAVVLLLGFVKYVLPILA